MEDLFYKDKWQTRDDLLLQMVDPPALIRNKPEGVRRQNEQNCAQEIIPHST
jgi:hypothetical protein